MPKKQSFTSVMGLLEYIDYNLDGAGLTVTDGRALAVAIADSTDLPWDMSYTYEEAREESN